MTPSHRALVVDDDPNVRDLLEHVLGTAGLEVSSAETGEEALATAREVQPDIVTLDLSLPDMDGTEVCRRLREFSNAYVVMITGRDAEIDRLVGLEVGADDYMAKPFSPREVLARVSALLRRPRLEPLHDEPSVVTDAGGGLLMDSASHTASMAGEPLPLTQAEFDLLAALASQPGQVRDREAIVREVWQGDFIESDFLVDVHVANIRRKLRRAGAGTSLIRTVGGSAYVFDPA
ncbi:response regulator transcription factor [Nocardioides sp. 503]|jgi:DNA-binding response OmpR family regulator|uniref:response regulator transcription factor n=1 Tax=Nocardioides sp. 503 TaxID=2508326 RepID=UPI00106FAF3E|nr:response regulator transcription factor [Nocardioides sp. 503]